MDQQHNRAIKLLLDKGHRVRSSDSRHILLDGRSYHVSDELIFFVEDAYPEEWRRIEHELDDSSRIGESRAYFK